MCRSNRPFNGIYAKAYRHRTRNHKIVHVVGVLLIGFVCFGNNLGCDCKPRYDIVLGSLDSQIVSSSGEIRRIISVGDFDVVVGDSGVIDSKVSGKLINLDCCTLSGHYDCILRRGLRHGSVDDDGSSILNDCFEESIHVDCCVSGINKGACGDEHRLLSDIDCSVVFNSRCGIDTELPVNSIVSVNISIVCEFDSSVVDYFGSTESSESALRCDVLVASGLNHGSIGFDDDGSVVLDDSSGAAHDELCTGLNGECDSLGNDQLAFEHELGSLDENSVGDDGDDLVLCECGCGVVGATEGTLGSDCRRIDISGSSYDTGNLGLGVCDGDSSLVIEDTRIVIINCCDLSADTQDGVLSDVQRGVSTDCDCRFFGNDDIALYRDISSNVKGAICDGKVLQNDLSTAGGFDLGLSVCGSHNSADFNGSSREFESSVSSGNVLDTNFIVSECNISCNSTACRNIDIHTHTIGNVKVEGIVGSIFNVSVGGRTHFLNGQT